MTEDPHPPVPEDHDSRDNGDKGETSPPVADTDWPPAQHMLSSLFVFEPATARTHPILVLGLDCAAPHGLADLPPRSRALLEKADVICASSAMLAELTAGTTEPCTAGPGGEEGEREALFSGARLMPLTVPLEPLISRLAHWRAAGSRVVVVAGGDPLFFGIGATLTRQLGRDAVRIVPAVSSLQAACARLHLPWHPVIPLSLHGRSDLTPLNAAAGRGQPLCILTDAAITPDVIARHLLDRGVDWFAAHVFECMGASDEAWQSLTLADVARATFGPACVLLLVPCAPVRSPRLGLDEAELACDGCMTRKAVRAAALSLLRIGPRHVVWDVGAGSGALSLEAASLAHEGRVVAIERDAGRAIAIQENRRRFGAAVVELCRGHAPACFGGLPDPQRIFIGGGLSGRDGETLLAECCRRLAPGGRLVAACILLESFCRCRDALAARGWSVEIQQIQASVARPLGTGQYLAAHNPIFLLGAARPEH